MAHNLKKFQTEAEYSAATLNHPAVSWVISGDTVHFEKTPPAFQGKWKATYTGGTTSSADCDASSAITQSEITLTDLESLEIGNCVTSIGNYAFMGCSGLTSCTIGSGVTSIGEYAFRGCSALTSVNIPDGVTSIGISAFGYCNSLTSIDIPSGVTSIGRTAFVNCNTLTSIVIPSGVTSIGYGAFYNCTSLTGITINATTPPDLGDTAFESTNDCPIYVPSASVNTYKSTWADMASRIQAIP